MLSLAFRWAGSSVLLLATQRPTRFFRDEAWGNAYVVVADMIYGFAKGVLKSTKKCIENVENTTTAACGRGRDADLFATF